MSLYLSRLILNMKSRQVRSEMSYPYEMHRTLMHAFERYPCGDSENARQKFGVLFRPDWNQVSDHLTVYVQSTVAPDWSYIKSLDNYLDTKCNTPNPACKEIGASLGNLRPGQLLRFRLRANPTKRIGTPAPGCEHLKGKRVGLIHEEEQIKWLARKGTERERGRPGGFEIVVDAGKGRGDHTPDVLQLAVMTEGKQPGRKKEGKKRHKTTHLAVRFEGILRVIDVSALIETVARGVGPAKAYGFGLMSLGRCPSSTAEAV